MSVADSAGHVRITHSSPASAIIANKMHLQILQVLLEQLLKGGGRALGSSCLLMELLRFLLELLLRTLQGGGWRARRQ